MNNVETLVAIICQACVMSAIQSRSEIENCDATSEKHAKWLDLKVEYWDDVINSFAMWGIVPQYQSDAELDADAARYESEYEGFSADLRY